MNDWLERNRTRVLVIIGLAVTASALVVALRWQRPASIDIVPPPPTPTSGPLTVYVSGAVRQPDVYTLPPDSLVRDAVEAAGGPTADANLDGLNLAAALFDNQQIHVPAVGEALPVAEGEAAPAITGPININSATTAELESLPGIGPALAQAIVDYRDANGPFSGVEQLVNVSGIGPAKLEALQGLVTVQ